MVRIILSSSIILCWVVLMNSFSFAAHPLTTDDIGTVEVGEYELEIGYDNCKNQGELRNHSCGLSLKHGISRKLDIGISFPYHIEPKPAERLGRVSLSFKFLLIEEFFAFTLSNELGSEEYLINGILTREISSWVTHFNLGYQATGNENAKGEMLYSSALEYSPMNKIDLVGEVLGEETGFQNWLLGMRCKISEVCFFDIAYGNGFRETNEKIASGFHMEF
jgi:hypothetical protein